MNPPPDYIEDERPPMNEAPNSHRALSSSTMWGVITSIAAALGIGITLGNVLWSNGNSTGQLASVQAQHTAQITQMQTQLTGQQAILYSINDNLARLTQKINDMTGSKNSQ